MEMRFNYWKEKWKSMIRMIRLEDWSMRISFIKEKRNRNLFDNSRLELNTFLNIWSDSLNKLIYNYSKIN